MVKYLPLICLGICVVNMALISAAADHMLPAAIEDAPKLLWRIVMALIPVSALIGMLGAELTRSLTDSKGVFWGNLCAELGCAAFLLLSFLMFPLLLVLKAIVGVD